MVPVAISYEWDPCDRDKAKELQILRDEGQYLKAEHEDIASIAKGITGVKGHIHIAFGKVLNGDYETAEDVAAEVDHQIWNGYLLQPSNLRAYEILSGRSIEAEHFSVSGYGAQERADADSQLKQRMAELPQSQHEIFLTMYANPVISRMDPVQNSKMAS